jgi:hypothetical protein
MHFLYAYVRAALTASVCIVGLTLVTTFTKLPGARDRLTHDQIRISLPSTLLFLVLLTFAFTLVLGALGHWLLAFVGWRTRAHYIAIGSVLGLAVAVLLFHGLVSWPGLGINIIAFALAGGAAANSFWQPYVRGA